MHQPLLSARVKAKEKREKNACNYRTPFSLPKAGTIGGAECTDCSDAGGEELIILTITNQTIYFVYTGFCSIEKL